MEKQRVLDGVWRNGERLAGVKGNHNQNIFHKI